MVDWEVTFHGVRAFLEPLASASWPIAFATSVYWFRKPLAQLIGRVRKFSVAGSETDFHPLVGDQQSRQPDAGLPVPAAESAMLSDLPPPAPEIEGIEQETRKALDDLVPGSLERKFEWLLRMRALSESFRRHETNYRVIFGSQILALRYLNTVMSAPLDVLEQHFKEFASNPEWATVYKDRTFQDWLKFLLATGYVVEIQGEEPAAQITPFGRGFLQWLVTAGVSDARAA